MDTDALITGAGLIDDVVTYLAHNPTAGIFGRHKIEEDGTIRPYRMHTSTIYRELSRPRLTRGVPPYAPIARLAMANGWGMGENVFGGACLISWPCLETMVRRGYLDPPRRRWNSRIADDVYFSMCAVAAGFELGHFAAPTGPLCLAWRRLPLPAREIEAKGYKLVHSVDKGQNTSREDNGGMTPREYFRAIRRGQTR
jgi:hypothetical protein